MANEQLPIPEPTKAERDTGISQTIASTVRDMLENERVSFAEELNSKLKKMASEEKPVVSMVSSKGEPTVRLYSPTEPLYRRMSERERELRNPDSDHWMAEWIRAHFLRDRTRMFQAAVKLEEMFGRATTTEGLAAASGAFSTGTGASLIPRPLEQVVLIARDRVAKMRRFATNFTMTAQTHNVPTAAAMTAYMTTETSTGTQGEPTISNVQLTARKATVKAIVTEEALADAAINVVNLYATRGGGALGVLEDNQFFKDGNGTAPNVSAFLAATAFSETTSGTLSYTDLLTMYFNVGQQYRDRASWLVADDVLILMSALKDGNGRPFYQSLMDPPKALTDDPGAQGTILGKPVYSVPSTAGTIFFGDPAAAYIVGTRQGIQSAVSEHIGFDAGTVMFRMTERFDGINLDTSAGQSCTGITVVNTL